MLCLPRGNIVLMDKLIEYMNSMPVAEQHAFAGRCGTTVGYIRKAASSGQRLGESLCIAIERESDRVVICESMRPDVDWAYIRSTAKAA